MSREEFRRKILSLVLIDGLAPEERRARELLADLYLDLQAIGSALWAQVHSVVRAAEKAKREIELNLDK